MTVKFVGFEVDEIAMKSSTSLRENSGERGWQARMMGAPGLNTKAVHKGLGW